MPIDETPPTKYADVCSGSGKPMRMLDLFCGTHSFSKCMKELVPDCEVVSLDILAKNKATVTCDILEWDYKVYPPGYFSFVWGSPSCVEFSCALTTRPRNYELADSLVLKTLEIIDYFKPPLGWAIENPLTGTLKSRPYMADLPYYDVSYCKYGFSYQKKTRFWTNVKGFAPRMCRRDCDQLLPNGNHIAKLSGKYEADRSVSSLAQKHSIPQQLLKEFMQAALKKSVTTS